MLVKPQCIGHRITGIYIGASNVRRYFPRRVAAIEIEIDHLRIRCGLTADFWQDDPEIRDPRLSDWLQLKQLQGAGKRSSITLNMTPSGEDLFILGPATPADHSRTHGAIGPLHADVREIAARSAYPLDSPATAA